jgi:hypothetical protein
MKDPAQTKRIPTFVMWLDIKGEQALKRNVNGADLKIHFQHCP